MQELIQRWAATFGLEPEQVQSGLNTLMQYIQSKVPGGVWAQFASRVPQVRSWVGEAITMSQPIVRMAPIHTPGGDLAQLLNELGKAGFTPQTAMQFVPAVLEQVRAKAGPDLYLKVLEAVPALNPGASGSGGPGATVPGPGNKFLK